MSDKPTSEMLGALVKAAYRLQNTEKTMLHDLDADCYSDAMMNLTTSAAEAIGLDVSVALGTTESVMLNHPGLFKMGIDDELTRGQIMLLTAPERLAFAATGYANAPSHSVPGMLMDLFQTAHMAKNDPVNAFAMALRNINRDITAAMRRYEEGDR